MQFARRQESEFEQFLSLLPWWGHIIVAGMVYVVPKIALAFQPEFAVWRVLAPASHLFALLFLLTAAPGSLPPNGGCWINSETSATSPGASSNRS